MLPGIIQTGKKQGMQLMDDALVDLLIAASSAPKKPTPAPNKNRDAAAAGKMTKLE